MAALVVVFHHCLLVRPAVWDAYLHVRSGGAADGWDWLYHSPLAIFVNGPGAVLVFFVLSGLVLALAFGRHDHRHAVPFIVKRVLRIWPPFAAAILLSAGLRFLVRPYEVPDVSPWLNNSWDFSVTWRLIAHHLVLMDLTEVQLDNPIWSLVHEMRISLLFPLLALAARRFPAGVAVGSMAIFIVSYFLNQQTYYASLVWQCAMTGGYLFLFAAGAIMSTRLGTVRNGIAGLRPIARVFCWIVALTLLILAPLGERTLQSPLAAAALFVAGLGAILLVGLCTSENPVTRLLEKPVPEWLGRISYSLYLVHVPVLLAVFRLFPRAPYPLDIAAVLAISLGLSELLNRAVEKPSIVLGRKLAARL